MLTMVPPIRVAGRVSAKSCPPTWSSTMSTPAPPVARIDDLGEVLGLGVDDDVAPTSASAVAFASEVVVAITSSAPNAFASCTAIKPIADVAPTTSTRWPAVNPAWVTRASCSVANPTGRAAGVRPRQRVRHRDRMPMIEQRVLGEGAQPRLPTPGHRRRPVSHAGTDGGHLARQAPARRCRRCSVLVFGLYEPSNM